MKTLASQKDVADTRVRISALAPTDRARWGQMTVGEMVCHVTDAFASALAERAVAPVPPPPLPLALYKWLALQAPVKWPQNISTPPEMKQGLGGTAPGDFTSDVVRLQEYFNRFASSRDLLAAHPMFGPLTHAQWMRWGFLHMDHHLRQFSR